MPNVFLSPSTQEWNKYATEGNEEQYMNLLADLMEPYLNFASAIKNPSIFRFFAPLAPAMEMMENPLGLPHSHSLRPPPFSPPTFSLSEREF